MSESVTPVIFQEHDPTVFINMTPGSKAYGYLDAIHVRWSGKTTTDGSESTPLLGCLVPPLACGWFAHDLARRMHYFKLPPFAPALPPLRHDSDSHLQCLKRGLVNEIPAYE